MPTPYLLMSEHMRQKFKRKSQDFRRNFSDFAAAAPSGERAKAAKIQAKNRTNPLKAKNEKTPTDSGRGSTSKLITTNQNYERLHACPLTFIGDTSANRLS